MQHIPNAESNEPRLFAVCLGGRADGCNVELHDVVFAVGTSLEAVHPQLLDRWFGEPEGLHVDAWAELDQVPGFRVSLGKTPVKAEQQLYFINIGGYVAGEFGERHAYGFYAGAGRAEVKARAKRELLTGKQSVHRDDLVAIDDVLEVEPGDDWHVRLDADPEASAPAVINGYFPIPRSTIAAWRRARKSQD
ncbi:MAG TPA: DUF1543 domain-containing protein [Wenzhouxiangellaceae bacterium]|nr:DUF1543 domain-containing protein [Wenzhouxiangellaceae bacterium]